MANIVHIIGRGMTGRVIALQVTCIRICVVTPDTIRLIQLADPCPWLSNVAPGCIVLLEKPAPLKW